MSELILERLFDSPVRVKLIKFFIHNWENAFTLNGITQFTQSKPHETRRELDRLESIGLIRSKKGRQPLYETNGEFVFLNELKNLVTKSSPASKERMLERLRRIGRIKLAVLSGIFMNLDNAKADLLIVGDGIAETKLHQFFRDLEAEVGKELDYVVLSSEEFQYRFSMYDRFVRDLMERPHEKLINRMEA
ncbi:MAG: hypothetical protein Q8R13_02275 [bacterium]|nr:hypothetical protein [bacterium]